MLLYLVGLKWSAVHGGNTNNRYLQRLCFFVFWICLLEFRLREELDFSLRAKYAQSGYRSERLPSLAVMLVPSKFHFTLVLRKHRRGHTEACLIGKTCPFSPPRSSERSRSGAFIIHLRLSGFSHFPAQTLSLGVREGIYYRHLLIYNEKLVALGPEASALAAEPGPLDGDGMSDTGLEPRPLPALREIAAPWNTQALEC